MEIFKLIAVAITISALCYYLKCTESNLFIPALIISIIILLSFAIKYFSLIYDDFNILFSDLQIDKSLINLLLKIVFIAYLIEFASGLIEDFGLKSIADKLVFAGKILLLFMSVPIFELIIQTINLFLTNNA